MGCSRPPFLSPYLSNERANQTPVSVQNSKGWGAESSARPLVHPDLQFLSFEDVKPKSLAYIVQLFVFFHSLSVHLKSDWLQDGIIMCSIVYLAFDPNTKNW